MLKIKVNNSENLNEYTVTDTPTTLHTNSSGKVQDVLIGDLTPLLFGTLRFTINGTDYDWVLGDGGGHIYNLPVSGVPYAQHFSENQVIIFLQDGESIEVSKILGLGDTEISIEVCEWQV